MSVHTERSGGAKPVRCGCGGEAKVAFCQQSYCGQNCFGDKKIKYRVYMICKKCHAREKPIITDWLINPHPWDSIYSGRIRHNAEQDEMFAPYVERAIEAWNRAMGAGRDKIAITKGYWRATYDGLYCSVCNYKCETTALPDVCPHCGTSMKCGCRLEWK